MDNWHNIVIEGDCLQVMPTMAAGSVDTIITDPPYGLGFMGKEWDHGVPGVPFWKEALRVAKPGAMLLAFGGTRTYHRLACAIEDAGWEVRDCMMWLYGQGFPKSLDISKAIDKAAGAEREVVGQHNAPAKSIYSQGEKEMPHDVPLTAPATDAAKLWDGWGTALKPAWEPIIVAMKPLDSVNSETIRRMTGWDWWHTSSTIKNDAAVRAEYKRRYAIDLPTEDEGCEKIERVRRHSLHAGVESDTLLLWQTGGESKLPARIEVVEYKPWCLSNAAANALTHGVAGLNIDGGRVGIPIADKCVGGAKSANQAKHTVNYAGGGYDGTQKENALGRWPANLILDDQAAAMLDEQSGESISQKGARGGTSPNPMSWGQDRTDGNKISGHNDTGGASRFFYCAKASRRERGEGNAHPTVKPLALMEYLCKLTATPTGGMVFDPFAGSGTTLVAARNTGRPYIGIELSGEYCEIARARLAAGAPLLTNCRA